MDTVEHSVKEIIYRIGEVEPGTNISKDDSIIDDLGVDSLALIDIVMLIEKKFQIMLEESDLAEVTNFGGFLQLIEKAINSNK